jgi:esterase/lipase
MHAWCRQTYWQPRHQDINGQETATESAEPYLLLPKNSNGLGAVLVHGFLASPAELKGLGEKLAALGHPVIGVRLAGHGTSPWDLRDRSWGDWLASVKRCYEIMSAFAERICVVGFSTGGSLALIHAADRPDGLSGLVSVSAPVYFRNKNLIFVPLVHSMNKMVKWVSNLEGLMPFRVNESEHPAINYRNIPIRGLYELRLIVDELKRRLPDVVCPVRLIQASGDNIVDPKSVDTIHKSIGSEDKSVHMVDADRHGIVTENLGGTHDAIIDFFGSL